MGFRRWAFRVANRGINWRLEQGQAFERRLAQFRLQQYGGQAAQGMRGEMQRRARAGHLPDPPRNGVQILGKAAQGIIAPDILQGRGGGAMAAGIVGEYLKMRTQAGQQRLITAGVETIGMGK